MMNCSAVRTVLFAACCWTMGAASLNDDGGGDGSGIVSNLCQVSEYIDENDVPVKEYSVCPQPGDPPDFTRCCDADRCCNVDNTEDDYETLRIGDVRLMMIGCITVIVLCIVAGIAIVVCCFVHGCPMYETCSGGWSGGGNDGGGFPFRGDYVPAADMHPLTLSNGGEGWNDEHELRKNHKLPSDDRAAETNAKLAQHV